MVTSPHCPQSWEETYFYFYRIGIKGLITCLSLVPTRVSFSFASIRETEAGESLDFRGLRSAWAKIKTLRTPQTKEKRMGSSHL
jgi:hypothetical protein